MDCRSRRLFRLPSAAEVLRFILALNDLEHLGLLGQTLDVGMEMDVTEAACELNLLCRRELLTAEEDDAVVEQRLVYVGKALVADVCKIDTAHLGAERTCDRLHIESAIAHAGLL